MFRRAAVLTLFTSALAAPANRQDPSSSYDFVIVGGGTSGLVVANRLSEDPNVSVAVIEAGGSVYNNTNVTSTTGYGLAFGTPIDWAYQSEPQVYAGNKSQVMRAAKALGGTSTINGMTYLRAETSQIDAWTEVGNNLTWEALFPYYKKAEHLELPSNIQIEDGASYVEDIHGYGGPLTVGWPQQMVGDDFAQTLNSTFATLGLPWNGEPNDGYMHGYNIFPKTLDSAADVREDAARAYYYPYASRSNLHVYLDSFAERLTWEDDSDDAVANGVVVRHASGKTHTVCAKKEVVLSAGALRSPLILEQSGVGNPAILQKHGIEVKVDLPFVGENLQDQTTTDMAFTSTGNFNGSGGHIGYFNVQDAFGNDTAASLSQTIKTSIPAWAQTIVEYSNNVVSQSAIEKLFEIQHKLIFEDLVVISEVIVNAPSSGSASAEFWGLMPFSRGNIHISSSNASAPASINPNYFQLPWDSLQQIVTARAARRVFSTTPFSNLITGETTPGYSLVPENATDAQWADWLKSTYRSNFHYISTAAMMSQELGGVVDDEHLVYGTRNVRVVDASVMPFQVSGHLTSTLYALAERAADLIKAKWA